MSWVPFAARLNAELDELAAQADQLLDVSGIDYRGAFNRGGGVVFIAPDWAWAAPTDELRRRQMTLVPRFDEWYERYWLLFTDAPEELRHQVAKLHDQVRAWLARDGKSGSGWDVPRAIPAAKTMLQERFAKLREIMGVVVPPSADGPVLAIPDTSALMNTPDFDAYPTVLGASDVAVYLVPGVLSELDALKDQGRTAEVRERARRAGRAIKEVRQRGSLLDGVELRPGLRVFSRPREPRFENMPGALDPAVPDDRILAAAFELQREYPACAVVLVTSDVNLQTKAELARLPFAEPPEPPA